MKSEQYFFRYAFPCAEVLLQIKRIDQKRFDEIKSAAEKGIVPSREILEDTFKTAFENIKKIAAKEGKDYWDISVIKKYFDEGEHNDFIGCGGGFFGHAPATIKDLCMIKTAIVEEIKADDIQGNKSEIVKVKYDGKERMCINFYNLKIKKGDKVKLHYAYIIEKV
jgi:hypothetical protein